MTALHKKTIGLLLASFLILWGGAHLNSVPKAYAAPRTSYATAEGGDSDVSSNAADACAAPQDTLIKKINCRKQSNPQPTTDVNKIIAQVGQLSTWVNYIFNPAINFITFKIGALLSNDYIFAGTMGTMLQSIWRVNRNIVNIIFVLVLLYLALKYIFGSEEGGTDLKKVLPMFALMLIAVNFSWLASKVVLDAASVATQIVFSLPTAVKGVIGDEVLNNQIKNCEIDPKNGNTKGMCSSTLVRTVPDAKFTVNLNDTTGECNGIEDRYKAENPPPNENSTPTTTPAAPAADATTPPPAPTIDQTHPLKGINIFCWKTIDLADYNQNNASYFLSYSMARVQRLTQASTSDAFKLSIGVIFSILIQVVYLVAFASLFIAMILRIAVLWFFVAFSPLLVLALFLEEHVKELKLSEETLSMGTFIQWAFAPAKLGAVWAVGFMMITMGQTLGENFFSKANAEPGQILNVGALFMGMDNLQEFMWLLMTVGIIWVGTFAVLTKLEIGKEIFAKINSAGTRVAEVVGKSPILAPIMPIYDSKGGVHMESIAQLKKEIGFGNLLSKWEALESGDANSNSEKYREGSDALGEIDPSGIVKLRTLLERKDLSGNQKAVYEIFHDKTGITKKDIKDNSTDVQNMITGAGGRFGKELSANSADIMFMLKAAAENGEADKPAPATAPAVAPEAVVKPAPPPPG